MPDQEQVLSYGDANEKGSSNQVSYHTENVATLIREHPFKIKI